MTKTAPMTKQVIGPPIRSFTSPYITMTPSAANKEQLAIAANHKRWDAQQLSSIPHESSSLLHVLANTFSRYSTGYNELKPKTNPPIAKVD
eukprot:CAMPEP_0197309880 /NCGR_PEP_ID=MMETSP0891-20130614/8500_1 /TAXON_ID=44058 ORGANISM="Aureoumbra lagunensis, Strain CCMP1510" /NCGR_SAMPLE_ID=MMETSP0891 /ASSEMBLY_ACC=CAM_ASM_000534 /LENGTH=90 /DNA_ID=CAMNT_0042795231 /DNA_START=1425 /DNA_END=1694 /DNA_ORIENTATION=+